MADLPQGVFTKMQTYALQPEGPMTFVVPGTETAAFLELACWNWALSGGTMIGNEPTTPDAICQAIFLTQDGLPTGLNRPFQGFVDCDVQLAVIEANFGDAFINADEEAQRRI